jgi:hypothetical protein
VPRRGTVGFPTCQNVVVAGRSIGLDAVGDVVLRIGTMAVGKVQVQMRELSVSESGAVPLVEVDIAAAGEAPCHGEDA